MYCVDLAVLYRFNDNTNVGKDECGNVRRMQNHCISVSLASGHDLVASGAGAVVQVSTAGIPRPSVLSLDGTPTTGASR